MASSKKNAKTNKTAHVLNVITGGREQSEPTEEHSAAPASASASSTSEPAPRPPVAPVLEIARADDDALSAAILSALTEEVTGEKPAAAPVEEAPSIASEPAPTEAVPQLEPEPAPVPAEAVPQPEPAPVPAEAAPQPEPEPAPVPAESVPQPEPAPVEAAPQLEPAPTPVKTDPQPEPPAEKAADTAANNEHYAANEDVAYHNITQALVEDKTEKYMKMVDMCCCPRCAADVKALALSNLPPKYIVMHKTALTPMLSYYEKRFGAAITAQIFSACRLVKESPRH